MTRARARTRTPPPPPPPPTTRGGRVRLGRRARARRDASLRAVSDGRGASGSAPEGFERLREEVRPKPRVRARVRVRREPTQVFVFRSGPGPDMLSPDTLRAALERTRGSRVGARAGHAVGAPERSGRGERARLEETETRTPPPRRGETGGANETGGAPFRPRAVDAFVARSDARREDERGPDATEDGRFGRRVARAARAGAARAVAFEEGAFGSPRGKRRLFLGRRKRKRIARPVRRVRGVRAALERVHVREGASRSRRARSSGEAPGPGAYDPAAADAPRRGLPRPRRRSSLGARAPRKSESRRRRRRRRPRRRKKNPAQEPRSAEPPPVKAARTCVSLWRPSASPSRRRFGTRRRMRTRARRARSSSPRRRRGTRSRSGGVSDVATDRIPRTKVVTTRP